MKKILIAVVIIAALFINCQQPAGSGGDYNGTQTGIQTQTETRIKTPAELGLTGTYLDTENDTSLILTNELFTTELFKTNDNQFKYELNFESSKVKYPHWHTFYSVVNDNKLIIYGGTPDEILYEVDILENNKLHIRRGTQIEFKLEKKSNDDKRVWEEDEKLMADNDKKQ